MPALFLSLITAYLLVLTLASWCFRAPRKVAEAMPVFALLVPAHNEEVHICDILNDFAACDYSADRLKLFIIADNCSDRTAEICRGAGAAVLERHNLELRGKGHALDWALREHAAEFAGSDCIAIVDADMHIDPQFFRALAASFASAETQVVQGLNTVAHPEQSWRAALGFVAFTAINHTRPAGRDVLGGTAELKGSGMAFRRELLLRYGWPAHSLAEDAEFSKRLLFDGIRVRYQPLAKVTSPIAQRRAQADVQQERWEGGKLYLLKQYLPLLLSLCVRKPSVRHLDALLDILVPPMSMLAMLCAVCLGGSIFVGPVWTAAVLMVLAALVFYVLSGLLQQRAPFRVWMYLLAVPVFLAWKLPLYARILFRGPKATWQRTPRDGEIQ